MEGQSGDIADDHERPQPARTGAWLLKHLRGQRGWTQSQLAHRIQEIGAWYRGAPTQARSLVSMISKWESGAVVPDPYNLHLLAEALNVPVEDLGFVLDPHYVHPTRRKSALPFG